MRLATSSRCFAASVAASAAPMSGGEVRGVEQADNIISASSAAPQRKAGIMTSLSPWIPFGAYGRAMLSEWNHVQPFETKRILVIRRNHGVLRSGYDPS